MNANNDNYDCEGENSDTYVSTSPLERLAASFDNDYYNYDNGNNDNDSNYDDDNDSNNKFDKAPYNSPSKTTDGIKNAERSASYDNYNHDFSKVNNNNNNSNNSNNNNNTNYNKHDTNDNENAYKSPEKQKKEPSDLDTLLEEFNELMIKLQEPDSKTQPHDSNNNTDNYQNISPKNDRHTVLTKSYLDTVHNQNESHDINRSSYDKKSRNVVYEGNDIYIYVYIYMYIYECT
jgi:hypothetical protein